MRARTWSRAAALAAGLVVAAPWTAAAEIAIDANTFGGMEARSIGPAVMSGRIAAIDAVATDPLTVWVGAASGGVWKSTDAGITWEPVFDDHIQSIGAIRVDPSDPEIVWVGTGESWARNSVSIGDGVYRSTDGGDSWRRVGLEASERIARIHVHPDNGDVAWVCATGQLWSANEERGVFKTEDAGATWQRVLFVDDGTGCADLAIDPQDPEILYAAMWQFRRYPDFFESGGPGSGLYKSTDGGATWRELTEGLPAGDKGRIGVAVAPSRPNRVYAVVEAEDTGLYRSDDLGESWTLVNESNVVAARPFYFAYLVVDPVDFNRVYKPATDLGTSVDGGRSFSTGDFSFGGSVHSDHHALWINPANPHELFLGTDGGLYVSNDRGGSFRHVRGLPLSQFYEVSHDLEWPYNVFGGLQDNGSWMGPSRSPGGIENKDWLNVGFGDGFHVYRDPTEPDIIYSEFQGGQLLRYRLSTAESKWTAPLPGEGEPKYRFNWNTPMHLSPTDPGTLYVGAQFLFRSRDRGDSWEKISPDLTTNDPRRQRQEQSGGLTVDNSTAENNATLFTISESPLEGDLIWVGTDDGLVQLTRDGGVTWTDVTAAIPGVPEGTWVSHVAASPHAAGRALVAFDGHRTGDMTTYVFRTEDHGATWESIVAPGLAGFAHVVAEDPVVERLLYAGTELGLYLSIDGGERWARFAGNLPPVPVHDLDVHPTEHDLIVGTHGRGVYILDDLTPLRALTAQVLESKFALLPTRPAAMALTNFSFGFSGDDTFVGRNPPEAATIAYYQSRRHIFGDLKVEIYDADGELVATLPGGKRKGINVVEWPMRLEPPKMPPATTLTFAFFGPKVEEGTYRYRVVKGKESFEGEVELVPDPRSPHSAEDRALQRRTAMSLYRSLERLTYVVEALIDLEKQAGERAAAAGERSRAARRLDEYGERLAALRAELVSTSESGRLSGEEKLRELLANVYGGVALYDGRPTQSQVDRAAFLAAELERAEARFEALTGGGELEPLNDLLGRAGLEPMARMSAEAWRAAQEGGAVARASLAPRELAALLARPLLPLGLAPERTPAAPAH